MLGSSVSPAMPTPVALIQLRLLSRFFISVSWQSAYSVVLFVARERLKTRAQWFDEWCRKPLCVSTVVQSHPSCETYFASRESHQALQSQHPEDQAVHLLRRWV